MIRKRTILRVEDRADVTEEARQDTGQVIKVTKSGGSSSENSIELTDETLKVSNKLTSEVFRIDYSDDVRQQVAKTEEQELQSSSEDGLLDITKKAALRVELLKSSSQFAQEDIDIVQQSVNLIGDITQVKGEDVCQRLGQKLDNLLNEISHRIEVTASNRHFQRSLFKNGHGDGLGLGVGNRRGRHKGSKSSDNSNVRNLDHFYKLELLTV